MNMMHDFNVSEERLKMEKQIELPIDKITLGVKYILMHDLEYLRVIVRMP